MRFRKPDSHRQRKPIMEIEFTEEGLTSYAGLELVRSFLSRLGFFLSLRKVEERIGFHGDTPFRSMILLILGLLLVGGRRLSHVAHLEHDPVVLRFAGLDRVPSRATVGRFLKQFNSKNWSALDRLNVDALRPSIALFRRRSLTIDLDGSVLTTGLQVAWAARGYNPHHRKNPSYYPLQAHIAETSQILAHRNRPGNVHDSRGAARFIRESSHLLRKELGHKGRQEWRTDAAFFQREILEMYDRHGLRYATKVPIVPWLGLKTVISSQPEKRWRCVDQEAQVDGLFVNLEIPCWNRTERVAIYRKRVFHRTRRNFQLDLFDPDDGTWEYSAVASNTGRTIRTLHRFMNGRGAQEKTYGELKTGYAYGAVPTCEYGANTAWQKLNILAHNLMVTFQMKTMTKERPRTRRNTATFFLQSIRTIRFEWLNEAGRIITRAGRRILRLRDNDSVRAHYQKLLEALPKVA